MLARAAADVNICGEMNSSAPHCVAETALALTQTYASAMILPPAAFARANSTPRHAVIDGNGDENAQDVDLRNVCDLLGCGNCGLQGRKSGKSASCIGSAARWTRGGGRTGGCWRQTIHD